MNMNKIFLLLFMLLAGQTAYACAESKFIDQMTAIESKQLLSNAPTFKQAWKDKRITITLKDPHNQGSECMAYLVVNLPQSDLDEASRHLDQNPSKRILSAAQGYSVPITTKLIVPFRYHIDGENAVPNSPNTPEVKELHNNIEYTYQLLAQLRLNLNENSSNNIAWSQPELDTEKEICLNKYPKRVDFCSCHTEKLSKAVSANQLEIAQYLETQPYSIAAGYLNGFKKLSENIKKTCSEQIGLPL
jgi:hypothetical protein